jgi:PAS domain S-box-containing protein
MISLELIQNITLLLTLSIAYQAILPIYFKNKMAFNLMAGFLFAVIGVLAMLTPLYFSDGLIVDGRTIILSMAGLIAGPLPALIAALVCSLYRVWLGGVGIWVGVSTILISAIFGSIIHLLWLRKKKSLSWVQVWIFGVLVHLVVLMLFLFLPQGLGLQIVQRTGLQILILFPISAVLLYLIFQDFESRLKEKQTLIISEQNFQMASEASKLGMWHWDILADRIVWDERCWRMLGYIPDEFVLNYEVWIQLIHPSDRQKALDIVQSSLKQSDSFSLEFRYQTAAGEWLWIEGRGKVIRKAEDQRPSFMTGIHLDISQRKKLAETTSEKEKIFNHSLDMLCMAGFDGYFKVLNPAWHQTLGWEDEELLSKSWMEFVHPDDREATRKIKSVILQGQEVYQFENRYLCKDGSFKWLAWDSFPYPEEKIMFGVARDITEKRQFEESLRYSEKKYRQLFTEMADGFALHEMLFDAQGNAYDYRYLEVNPAFERLTGLQRDDLIGRTVMDVLPETEPYWLETFAKVVRTGIPLHVENYSASLKKWFSVSAYSPEAGQFAVSFSDITVQKNIECQLKESLDKLEFLFDTLPIGISILDQQQKIVRQNHALAEIYGLSSEELLKGAHREWHYIRPDGSPMPREEFASSRIRRGEEDLKPVIMGTNKNDGSSLWLEVNGISSSLPDWNTILLTRDITERMQMQLTNEAYLEKLNQNRQYQEMILWLTTALREAKSRVEAQEIVVNLIVQTYSVHVAAIFQVDGQAFLHPVLAGEPVSSLVDHSAYYDLLFKEELDTGQFRIFHTRKEILAAVQGDQLFEPAMDSCLLLPILCGDEKIGVLVVGNQKQALPVDDLLMALPAMAEIIGVTLQRMGNVDAMRELISRRTLELSTLYNVIAVSGVQKSLNEKLDLSMKEVLLTFGCSYGGIFFLDDQRTHLKMVAGTLGSQEVQTLIETTPLENLWEGQVIQQAEPVIIPSSSETPNLQKTSEYAEFPNHIFIGVPIIFHGSVFGLVTVLREGQQLFNLEEITFLNALVNHIGVMIENHKLLEEVEQSALKEERTRISRQMHDSVTQTLYSAVLFANAGQDLIKENRIEQVTEVMSRLAQLTKQALNEMRLMLFEMRPPDLEQDGLVAALRKRLDMVENRAAIQTRFVVDSIPRLEPAQEEALYWIAIEALNNITRHAKAAEIGLELKVDAGSTTLSIKDNGIGFDDPMQLHHGGQGLQNMRERVQKINGNLEIKSRSGDGTLIIATVPNTHHLIANDGGVN